MQASKAIVHLAGKRLELTEENIAAINAAIANAPVGGGYNEDKIDASKRMQLVATLVIEAKITTINA